MFSIFSNSAFNPIDNELVSGDILRIIVHYYCSSNFCPQVLSIIRLQVSDPAEIIFDISPDLKDLSAFSAKVVPGVCVVDVKMAFNEKWLLH